jgi:threonine aldolase
MATSLAEGLEARAGVRVRHQVQANAVFVDLPDGVAQRLQARGWHFYNFLSGGGWRLMCSWDTTPADVAAFLSDLDAALAG